MRSKHLLLSVFLFASISALGQNVAVNNDGSLPDNSAQLDVKSNSKGILIPRMTAAQRSSIEAPAKGLLIYQVDAVEGFYYNQGTPAAANWILLGATGPTGPQGPAGNGFANGTAAGQVYLTGANPYAPQAPQTITGDVIMSPAAVTSIANNTTSGNNIAAALGSANTGTTGSGNVVLATSPALVSPNLGTPASGIATNLTGLPLTTGVTGVLPVANGGTGAAALTSNNILLGNGTNPLQTVAPGSSGNLLTSNGTTWTSAANTGWSLSGNSNTDPAINFIGTKDLTPLRFRVNNAWSGEMNFMTGNNSYGFYALKNPSTGVYNTALGYSSLFYDLSGSYNTSTGAYSMQDQLSGSYNTANGYKALYSITSGNNNTAIGSSALKSNTNGQDNSALGGGSLINNTSGASNTACGTSALFFNTTGNNNTATGNGSLYQNISGIENTAAGLNSAYQTTGNYNTAVGSVSLFSNITGVNNTALGYGADVSAGNLVNATALGNGAIVNASNKVRIGNTAVTVIEGQVAFTNPSDARFKNNIRHNVPGLDFITRLQPVTYNFDNKKLETYTKTGRLVNSDFSQVAYDASLSKVHTGFLAQDVERVAKKLGYDFDGVNAPTDSKGYYTLGYSQFVVPLVQAVKEQQDIISHLQKQIDDQKKENLLQKKQLQLILKNINQLRKKNK